jgi:hypothetical protein
MIEKRETALAKLHPAPAHSITSRSEEDPRNVDDAMLALGVTVRDPSWTEPCRYGTRMKLSTWAAQAGVSRPGRKPLSEKAVNEIKRVALDPDKLKWPRTAKQS